MGETGLALPGAQGTRRAGLWEQPVERRELPLCIQVLGWSVVQAGNPGIARGC